MEYIAGADGYRGGWVVVQLTFPGGQLAWEVVPTIEALFDRPISPSLLTIDIPIGLPERDARTCDKRARSLLGPGRASSVFPAPIRSVLGASSYAEASDLRYTTEGKWISKQTWAIIPKIREVDSFLRERPDARTRIREVHPEVCFYFMAGNRPMAASKKTAAGHIERVDLLAKAFGPSVRAALNDRRCLSCGADDLIDAFAGLWTALRIRDGLAETIPHNPPRDIFDLPMEIVA